MLLVALNLSHLPPTKPLTMVGSTTTVLAHLEWAAMGLCCTAVEVKLALTLQVEGLHRMGTMLSNKCNTEATLLRNLNGKRLTSGCRRLTT